VNDGPDASELVAARADPLRWWPRLNRDGSSRVFCTAHAGAGADYFRPLAREVNGWLTVHGLRLPGRERRLGEEPLVDAEQVAAVAAAAAAALGVGEYVAIGVCTGSRLAWRTVYALDRAGVGVARLLAVLDARPPGDESALDRLRRMDHDSIVRHLAGNGATPHELLADEEFARYAVSAYRADLSVAAAPMPAGGRISAPIAEIVTGPYAEHTTESAWATVTTAGVHPIPCPRPAPAGRAELLHLAHRLLRRWMPR
jgi:surfactin synthase thioesterase subunit